MKVMNREVSHSCPPEALAVRARIPCQKNHLFPRRDIKETLPIAATAMGPSYMPPIESSLAGCWFMQARCPSSASLMAVSAVKSSREKR